jgi:hypothetical protein
MPLPPPPVCLTPTFIAQHVEHPRPLAAPRPPAAVRAICTDPVTLAEDNDVPGNFERSESTAHFHFAWDDSNADLQSGERALYMQTLEQAWTNQIDNRGWKAPDQTDACLITVLLADFADRDSGTGGYCNADAVGDVPYIVINTDWGEYGSEWMTSLLYHEFNHASQFAYNVFWDSQDWWYWESTAEWIPYIDADLPEIAMWSTGYFMASPHRAMHSYEDYTQYGHMVFNQSLERDYGDDAPRAIWAAATSNDDVRAAVETGIPGADYGTAAVTFLSRAGALDVAEPEVWLEALGYFEIDDFWEEVDTLPASGQSGDRAPEELGANYLHFSGDRDATLVFAGDAEAGGRATDWAITLATPQADGSFNHSVVKADATGAATLTLPLSVEGEAYVGFVPQGEIGETGAGYTWSASAGGDGGDGGGGVGGDDDDAKSCGCNGGGAPVGFAWMLALAMGMSRRRSSRAGA